MLRGVCHEAEASEASFIHEADCVLSPIASATLQPDYEHRCRSYDIRCSVSCRQWLVTGSGFRLFFFKSYFSYYRGNNSSLSGKSSSVHMEQLISRHGNYSSLGMERFIMAKVIRRDENFFFLRHIILNQQ